MVAESDDSADGETGQGEKRESELEAQNEQALCKWFADHPLLYDLRHLKFKTHQRKDRLLDQMAKELNMTGT